MLPDNVPTPCIIAALNANSFNTLVEYFLGFLLNFSISRLIYTVYRASIDIIVNSAVCINASG